MLGCDVVIVDPPRKGLDMSLIEALQNISAAEHKAKSSVERFEHFVVTWIFKARVSFYSSLGMLLIS